VLIGNLAGCQRASEELGKLWPNGEAEEASEDLIDVDMEGISTPAPTTSGTLVLRLNVGDRFPMLKTVEQTLTQQTATGPAVSHSKLELLLAIEVEEIQEARKRLGVRYHRARYVQDIAGERSEYNSDFPENAATLPPELQLYAGLLENGFSFWIGADNQIAELVGFEEFLARCVRTVPVAQRVAVLTHLAETSGEEGIANFVDESIGLLPTTVGGTGDAALGVGAVWTRQREVARPVPLFVTHNCTLKSLDERTAEIDVAGTISASTAYGAAPAASSSQITVRGGHVLGNCVIDRLTGLPVRAQTERQLEMVVHTANGPSFELQKQIVTRIQAFPETGGAVETPSHDVPRIQPASAIDDGASSDSAVIPAGGASLAD
jgi:hypothetical protein